MIRYELGDRTEAEWSHLWQENPAQTGSAKEWPLGWILENEQGQIVGFFGNIPQDYELQGKSLTAAAAFSWVVEQPYRRQYAHSLLQEFSSQGGPAFLLNTSANPRTSKVFAEAGFQRVPIGNYGTSYYWITNHRGFATSALIQKGYPAPPLISRPLALALKSYSLIKSHPHARGGIQLQSKIQKDLTFLTHFDARFDQFWQTFRERKTGLIAVRDRRHLEWHYRYSILNQKAWILSYELGGEIMAFATFFKQDNAKIGLTRLRMADFQSNIPEQSPIVLAAMIEKALIRCKSEQIHMLELVGFRPDLVGDAQKAAPYHRSLPTWLYYYKACSIDLDRHLSTQNIWAPTFYDGDITL